MKKKYNDLLLIRIPAQQKKALYEMAKRMHTTVSDLVRASIQMMLTLGAVQNGRK
jgi:hypothetical protein